MDKFTTSAKESKPAPRNGHSGLHGPAQDAEIEQAVLGAVILERDALPAVIEFLRPEHFYSKPHQEIYQVAISLHLASAPVDMRTVVAELRKLGKLNLVGGATYIAEITSRVSSSANITYHARVLAQLYMNRRAGQLGHALIAAAQDPGSDPFEIWSKVKAELIDVYSRAVKPKNEPKVDEFRMTLVYKKRNTGPALSLQGHPLVHFGELCSFIGSPGQGKSAVCEAIAATALGVPSFGFEFASSGKKVLLIDTERPADQVSDSLRRIHARTGSDLSKDLARLDYLYLSELATPEELKEVLERQVKTNEYELVILDGILDFGPNGLLEADEAARVVKWLRALSVKFNVASVVTLHPNKFQADNAAGHLGAFLYRWGRAMLFIKSVEGGAGIKEITAATQQGKLSHSDPSSFPPLYFSWDPQARMMMPSNFQPAEDRGQTDRVNETLQLILSSGKRMRHADLVRAIGKLGKSSSTAKRWIEKGVAAGIITDGPVYSLVSPGGSEVSGPLDTGGRDTDTGNDTTNEPLTAQR